MNVLCTVLVLQQYVETHCSKAVIKEKDEHFCAFFEAFEEQFSAHKSGVMPQRHFVAFQKQ